MVRKRKIKKAVKLLSLVVIVLLVFLLPYFLINIHLIGNNKITIDYGDKYSESGYKGSFLGNNISKDIKVTDNINSKIGEYKVIYTYQWLFYKKTKTRTVEVKDVSSPKIELTGNNPYSLTIGSTYKEPGFKATDNLDGDLTKEVKVKDNIDSSKIGNYEVTYIVKDKSGNKAEIKRTIKVDKKSPLQMSLSEYTLKGYDEEYQLKETPVNEKYFSEVVLVGDSNIKNLFLNGYVKGKQAWYLPCIHAESYFHEKLYIGGGEQILLLDAVKKYKPKYLIFNIGTFSTAWISDVTFKNKGNELIEEIKKASPDTKLIISSIYPISSENNINNFKQEDINYYNYQLLQMTKEHNLKFLNVQEVLKGPNGYGKPNYFLDDKFHFSAAGFKELINYIKTHAWEE